MWGAGMFLPTADYGHNDSLPKRGLALPARQHAFLSFPEVDTSRSEISIIEMMEFICMGIKIKCGRAVSMGKTP